MMTIDAASPGMSEAHPAAEPTAPRTAYFITHSPPSPGISGDRIRVFHLMRAIKERGWTVRLWSLVGPMEPAGSVDAVRLIADEVVIVPRDVGATARRLHLLQDAMARRALHAHWFWSASSGYAAAKWLAEAEAGVIFVEQLYMVPFVPRHMVSRVVLDTQNDETARMRAISTGDGNLGRRMVARSQIGPVQTYQCEAVGSVGRVLAVSDLEAAEFEQVAPGRVRLVPNGVDARSTVPNAEPPVSSELLFLGSLSYGANVDAVRHFAVDISPHLSGSGATLTIVGSNPPRGAYEAAVKAAIPTAVIGYAPELGPHYRRSRAMIVPLRHGGGTRLKILEALAWGLPVVTTSVGAAGLGLIHERHVLVADEPADFAAAVRLLLRDDALWRRLSLSGRQYVEERFDWHHIASSFEAAMREVADGSTGGVPT